MERKFEEVLMTDVGAWLNGAARALQPQNLWPPKGLKANQCIRRVLPAVPRSTPHSKRGSLLNCNLSTPGVNFPYRIFATTIVSVTAES
jgi:hypothetical protein